MLADVRGFDVNRFVQERGPSWTRLESVLVQVENNGLGSLDIAGARELGKLYRAVSSDLIRARTELVNATVVDYLNDIVARCYAQLHASSSARDHRVRDFFIVRFPRLFRHEWRAIALAAAVMLSGGVVGASFVAVDPQSQGALIPDDHQEHTPQERVHSEQSGDKKPNGDASVAFSGWLFTHNIEVSFLVFALGITFGVGTLALLFYNGVPLGALAMQYHGAHLDLFFWAWILPHGVAELTEVCIAGGAGLIVARGLWLPDRRSRRDALVREAKTAACLVLGGMPILVLAGVIEGTISQLHEPFMPYAAKLLFALLVAAGVYTFLLSAGRSGEAADDGVDATLEAGEPT
ncbi:MAG TPA: stage II sporulation protein M [Polyangiales bacterium]